jgi:hypothetical protein
VKAKGAEIIAALMLLARRGITSYDRISNAMPLIGAVRVESDKEPLVARVESYVVKVSGDGSYTCSCSDFQYRGKLCKHTLAVLMKAPSERAMKIIDAIVTQRQQPTPTLSWGIKALDELALLPVGVIGVIGPSKVGKTLFVSQILYKLSADLKRPGLYIDTEGFYTPEAIASSEQIFSKRLGEGARVEFMRLKTLESLLSFFGLDMVIEAREKKIDVSVTFSTPADETPAMKIASFLGASAMAIDSFTMPIKRIFGSGTQNLPARAALINALFARLEEMSSVLEIPIFVTHHVGKSPINPYDPYKPYGGSALLYNLKHILLVLHGEKPDLRRVVRFAWPYKTRDEVTLKLVENHGYAD